MEFTMLFKCVDYEKAFDSVDREIVWKLFDSMGSPTSLPASPKPSMKECHAESYTESISRTVSR